MRRLLFLLLLPGLLGGCIATQQDVSGLENHMNSLQGEIIKLRQTLDSIQKNTADSKAKGSSNSSEFNRLRESIDGVQAKVSDLGVRLDDIKSSMDAKFKALGKTLEPPPGPTPSDLFRQAEGALARKDYDLAIQGFDLYIKGNPTGSLADQAQYLRGEAYLDSGRPYEAARAYAKVLDGFPQSPLTASARLRYAQSLLKLDASKSDEAVRYLESIPEDFPAAPEAKRAQELLKELKAKAPAEAPASSSAPAPSPAPSPAPPPAPSPSPIGPQPR